LRLRVRRLNVGLFAGFETARHIDRTGAEAFPGFALDTDGDDVLLSVVGVAVAPPVAFAGDEIDRLFRRRADAERVERHAAGVLRPQGRGRQGVGRVEDVADDLAVDEHCVYRRCRALEVVGVV